jgi:hypothetical protein
MPIIDGVLPASNDAMRAFEAVLGAGLPADVQDTCLVALQSVGRARWDQHHQDLALARSGQGDFDNAVNCYITVVKWAVMSGAIPAQAAGRFCSELTAADGSVAGANSCARDVIYNWIPHRGYVIGDAVPYGAMVYHGDRDNPIAHVTLHVGNNMVVGCWAAAYMQSPALQAQFEDLINRGWRGDTMLTAIDAFGGDKLDYSLNPFWHDLRI